MRPNPSSPKSAAKPTKKPAEAVVKDIRRATRRHFSAEDKIRIVLEGLRGEESIAELCRREGITARAATSDEVKDLRRETLALKECVADLTLENRLLKKSLTADGGEQE